MEIDTYEKAFEYCENLPVGWRIELRINSADEGLEVDVVLFDKNFNSHRSWECDKTLLERIKELVDWAVSNTPN